MSIAFNDRAERGRTARRGETAPIGHLVDKITAELGSPNKDWPSKKNPKELRQRLLRALSTIRRTDPGRIRLTRTRIGQLIELALRIAEFDLAQDGGILSASNSYYGGILGVKPATMTTIFRDLKKSGLIEERNPTINHRRWCHMTPYGNRDGRGYSLKPAVAMLDKLEHTAQTLEQEHLTLTATQFEAKQMLAECKALASELFDEGSIEELGELRRALKNAYAAKSIEGTSTTLHAAATLKAKLSEVLKSRFKAGIETNEISDQTREDSRQHHTAQKPHSVKVSALRGGSSGDHLPLPRNLTPESARKDPSGGAKPMTCGVNRREAYLLFTSGREFIPATDDHQDWIIAACDIGKKLNINPRLMAKGFETLGIEQMLWGLHIVQWRVTNGMIDKNAGAYFNGMLRKAQTNELDLDRTIWGIRTELGLRN